MELPSLRELELESHLRERDTRLAELTVRDFIVIPAIVHSWFPVI